MDNLELTYETSKMIMSNCKDYPKLISSQAEKICRLYANENLKPIGDTASLEKWFDEN
jgi:hypothetical protein